MKIGFQVTGYMNNGHGQTIGIEVQTSKEESYGTVFYPVGQYDYAWCFEAEGDSEPVLSLELISYDPLYTQGAPALPFSFIDETHVEGYVRHALQSNNFASVNIDLH